MATKYKCKLAPKFDSIEKYIWEIRSLQLKDPDQWTGRTFYYCNPPYYKMKAITNTEKVIHFSFKDSSVPVHLRSGGKGFCHQMAQDYISDSNVLNVYYKGKRFRLRFEHLEQEVKIQSGSNYFYADLQGKISSPSWFINDIGTDSLIIEISFSSRSKIKKQSGYRESNLAAIEVNYKDCFSYQNEKYFPTYSDEKLEKAQQTLLKFIDNSYPSFKVLHFPSQKNKRYQEGRITRRAKSAYSSQEKSVPEIPNQKLDRSNYVIPNLQVSESSNTSNFIHNKKETKSFLCKVYRKLKNLIRK
ncbi:hypothetical protein QYS49_11955 [Marivirga salinae]|uniref:Uncharacterized protein n=1 Tax=Marivirga salinarum TaxID=3059078 RepID=A0AA49J8X8_9BACT|nr:hypothetical protein [Marivirga sp. BDSF4-3]WKK77734.2 hypothetical protein QYS49_11955 [Marivirga sp. BDSF4-3]